MAILMEIFLDRGNSKLPKDVRQENVEDLCEYHPDLLWAASEKLGIPSWFQNDLSEKTGRPWPAILNELENKYA